MLIGGPNRTCSRYIGQVLPSLGEQSVEQREIDALISRPHREISESRELATLKGSGRMAVLLERLLWSRLREPDGEVIVRVGNGRARIGADDVVALQAAARFALKRQQEGAAEMLAACLARYRGDFLDGEPVGDWHLEHRDRLQRLYVDSLMELGARYASAERHEKAAEAYRRVLARDDLHEDALVALMRCHAGLGERSQALRVYQRFADRMRTELDAAPTHEATRLFERRQQGTR